MKWSSPVSLAGTGRIETASIECKVSGICSSTGPTSLPREVQLNLKF